ncbi:hypothetical protein XA68_12870 [Ophiocordyceps unilateralis]|uniref:U3 small nucleolar RNA-associated protein 15 C-terminal domain-containing protein n=1 Tax=Ophiocordyceps unilateralis TaxID=268505 RepID=A0A2A9PMM8_OPHUN|nr:hypothetical protein XA68_12870 [Ophiocordyceps unilateralis]
MASAPVEGLQAVKLPDSDLWQPTREQKYWRSFRDHVVATSATGYAATHLSAAGSMLAVTTGPRVELYSMRSQRLLKTISRFDHLARGASLRCSDGGRVMSAGDDSGVVRVFDTGSRAVLRTWKNVHRLPVWVTRWAHFKPTVLLTACDDATVRLWDLASDEPTTTLVGHDAYVRCANFMPDAGAGSGTVVSGCYDGTVKLWDPRLRNSAVMTFSHADAVEAVLPLPSSTVVLAAAASDVSVLDLVAARPRCIVSNHQKTVTSLALASSGRRLLTGALDGHVKVLDTTDWNLVTTIKYSSPVLAMLVVPSPSDKDADRHLAVSMQSGDVSIRTRRSARDRQREGETAALIAGDLSLPSRDTTKRKHEDEKPVITADTVIPQSSSSSSRKRKKEPICQRLLRQGRYNRALDHAVNLSSRTYSSHQALHVLRTLSHCNAMREALPANDERRLLALFTWLSAHIFNPPFVAVCVELALHLLDLHAEFIASSDMLTTEFRRLRKKVKMQLKVAKGACRLEGVVESFMLGVGHQS